MNGKEEIPLEEAKKEVELASRRIGLLHLAYAETLINELGEEEGKKVILESIKNYGSKVGEKVRDRVEAVGLEPDPKNFGNGNSRNLPKFGMNEKAEEVEVDGEKGLECTVALWQKSGKDTAGKKLESFTVTWIQPNTWGITRITR